MWLTWFPTLVLVAIGWRFYTVYVHKRAVHNSGCSEPSHYPHLDPILGLDLFIKFNRSIQNGNSFDFYQNLFNRYGKTFVAVSWGRPVVHTMEPSNFRAVLSAMSAKFAVAPIRYDALSPLMGDGVFVTDGETHERGRNLIKPLFALSHQRDTTSLHEHVQLLLDRIPRDGTKVDMQPLLESLFLDTTTQFFLAQGTGCLAPGETTGGSKTDHFLQAFNEALSMGGMRMFLGKFRFLLGSGKAMQQSCRRVHDVVDEFIDDALNGRNKTEGSIEGRETFIDSLRNVVRDRVDLRCQLLNVLLPALDTTAIALSDMLFQLARNPRVWSKLREEALLCNTPLSFKDVRSMTYLRAVMNESLRLIGPFGRNIRTCTEDCILPLGGGSEGKSPILVRSGTEINMVFRSTHQDPNIWGADTGSFRPERWIDDKKSAWEYMPFSAGSRACPGQQMALLDCGFVLARLAQEFSTIQNMDDELNFIEEHRMAMKSRHGVLLAFR